MSEGVSVRPFDEADRERCADVLATLPHWFGISEANAAYIASLQPDSAFVAERTGEVVGFIGLAPHFDATTEIHVLATRLSERRSGVGRALMQAMEGWAIARNRPWLFVQTLGPSHPDAGYAETRAFYMALGFQPLVETTALWGADQPALTLVKLLRG